MAGAARILGVHVNTVRAWTDQGRLACLRINSRGDRRYAVDDLQRFLADAGRAPGANDGQLASLLGRVAALCAEHDDPEALLRAVAQLLLRKLDYDGAALIGANGDLLASFGQPTASRTLAGRARSTSGPVFGTVSAERRTIALATDRTAAVVLQLSRPEPGHLGRPSETLLLEALGAQLDAALTGLGRQQEQADVARRAELLLSTSSQIAAQHDLPGVLEKLLDSALELFGADHGAVLSRRPDGGFRVDAERRLGSILREAIEAAPTLPLVNEAYETRAVASVADYHLDPRSAGVRAGLLAAKVNTVSVAPLISDGELLGALALHHDQAYRWRGTDLLLFEQLAGQGAAALRNARLLSRSEARAAQLQSIQQLGMLLNRLEDPREIGQVITAELGQLVDYHNVRVYRVEGEDVVPLAWRGKIGEYADEDGDQLRLKVGHGITGWVAQHGVGVNLADAAKDPRAETIPGTEDDLDESMLVVPMLHEDTVIGVLVLSKLGLNQFTDDDRRLIEIFAAIAAAAMAGADATERLRRQSEALARQVASQRELLRVTQSILGTLDRQEVLEEIAQRLATLLQVDNVSVDLYDPRTRRLEPIFARGTHARLYLSQGLDIDSGLGGYAVRTGEPVLVRDQLTDPRVVHFAETGPLAGALVVLPLHARDKVQGVLTIERLGGDADFSDEEFELAKLFAGHVSIALQNAEAHHAVEMRAQTDALTGLLNHGELIDRLADASAVELEYGLLMIDLDDFKSYNDRYGHQAGDALLRQLALAMRRACRDSDEIYRYGGDEFAIVLPSATADGAYAVAEKIRAAVSRVSGGGRGASAVTCSIGVAAHPHDGFTGEEILLAADRACFVAKHAGRNRIATAAQGAALAGELLPPPPTPVDVPEASYPAA